MSPRGVPTKEAGKIARRHPGRGGDEADDLGPDFELEPVWERLIAPQVLDRVSRVRAIRAEKNMMLTEDVAQKRNFDGGFAQYDAKVLESLNSGLKIATEQGRPVWTKALEEWRAYKTISDRARSLAMQNHNAEASTVSMTEGRAVAVRLTDTLTKLANAYGIPSAKVKLKEEVVPAIEQAMAETIRHYRTEKGRKLLTIEGFHFTVNASAGSLFTSATGDVFLSLAAFFAARVFSAASCASSSSVIFWPRLPYLLCHPLTVVPWTPCAFNKFSISSISLSPASSAMSYLLLFLFHVSSLSVVVIIVLLF